MTVHLGKDSAYAVFALVELATRGTAGGAGTPVAVPDLADSTGIGTEALSVILGKLTGANIVAPEGSSPERFILIHS